MGTEIPFTLTKGGGLFLPCWFGYKGKKGREKFCLLVRVFQQKNREKESEGEERKKRERREEKRRNKATSLGVFVSKVYYSVCMVFFGFFNG